MQVTTWTAVALATAAVASAAARPTDEAAIRSLVASSVEAWNESNPAGIASAYEPSGDFVSPDGLHAIGRLQIATFYAGAFANGYAHSHGGFEIRSLRFEAPGFAIVDGVWSIDGAHDKNGKERSPERGLAVILLHKVSGAWKVVAMREQSGAAGLHPL
jgi:uncharacterized protein (TIGR02246 family)